MDAAKEYAKTAIESDKPSGKDSVIKMFQFSRQYRIDDWFGSTFRKLVERQMTTFTMQETEKIGFRTLLVIAKTRDAIEQHRRYIARFPPPVKHSPLCSEDHHKDCASAYEDLWWKVVGRALLDPKYYTSTKLIPSLVDRVVATNMNPKCWERTKRDIIADKFDECLKGEDWIIEKVVDTLKEEGDNFDAVLQLVRPIASN
jgi:hypothetical protein